jgi:hypothetical protein
MYLYFLSHKSMMPVPNHEMEEQNLSSPSLTDDEKKKIRQFIVDLFSIDVITAKGDIDLQLTSDTSIFGEATGDGAKIKILARTIIQFGGDQLVIIPTIDSGGNGDVLSIDPKIWEIHKENVNSAILNRKNNLDFIADLIVNVSSHFKSSKVPHADMQAIYDLLQSMKQDSKKPKEKK